MVELTAFDVFFIPTTIAGITIFPFQISYILDAILICFKMPIELYWIHTCKFIPISHLINVEIIGMAKRLYL